MDQPTKMFLARVLGEIYRMQRRVDPSMTGAADCMIYGLINGIETAIDNHFADHGEPWAWCSAEQVSAMTAILEELDDDPVRKEAFKGYYDIEQRVQATGLSKGNVIAILTYLKLNGQFTELIKRLDSDHSPSGCRKFEPGQWDV